MTSRQVVNLVQRLVRPARTGHAGTLDPLATGVLVVGVGPATRLIQYVQEMPKRYVGQFLLGRQSPTEDIEGDVSELPDAPIPTREQVMEAAERFVGRIEQRPPAFSALKVNGRRAYKLARQGRQVQLAVRTIEIHGIEVRAFDYPELVLDVRCGSGTYIRSLGRDLAESLGTAAVMSALERTSIGGFHVEEALDPCELDEDYLARRLQPPLKAVEHLHRIQLSTNQTAQIRNGLSIELELEENTPPELAHELFAAVDPAGQFVGILSRSASGQLRTVRNFPTGV